MMDARLIHEMLAQRTAASHAVAGALSPRNTASPFKSAASPATTGAGSSSTSSTDSSTITSDDFLTLLVSELKNQDPTQPTDPNAYITQLAQVNSLEQLIQINKGVSTLDSSVTSTPDPTTGAAVPALLITATPATATPAASATGSSTQDAQAASVQPASASAWTSQIHPHLPGAAAQ